MNYLKPSKLTIEQWLNEYTYEIKQLPSWSMIDHEAFTFLCQEEGGEVQIINEKKGLISSQAYYIAPLDMFIPGESDYMVQAPTTFRLYRLRILSMLKYCLLTDDEPQDEQIRVEGVTAIFHLSMKRIMFMHNLIHSFIKELPLNFNEGASYHMMHTSKWEEEIPWTDRDNDCEALLVLGLATGAMKYKGTWPTLLYKVPSVQFT